MNRNAYTPITADPVLLRLNSCRDWGTLHQRIRKAFGFPDYYGENWDAMWDCLTDVFLQPVQRHIVVEGFDAMPQELRAYAAPMQEIFSDIRTIPLPTSDMFAGGSYEDDTMPVQETTIVPYKASSIAEATEILCKVYKKLPEVIREFQGGRRPEIGAMSEYMAPSTDFMDCLDILYETAKRCHCEEKIAFHMDCAFSEIYDAKRGTYHYCGREVDLDEIIGILKQATEKYNFLYIEDPVDENDWEGWVKAAKALDRTTLCGDDLTVTNINYLRKALDMGACGAFVFKPNQVGTVTEAMEAQRYAVDHGMFSIPSIRAGGVSDDPVADMGIAGGAAAVKLGPPKFGHAIHIVNSLLRAETELPEAKPFDFSPFVKF